MDLTLLVLAAGLGSRYGGEKQLDVFGRNGESLMEFSIYDAIKAGFNKVVFVVRSENLSVFQKLFHEKLSKHLIVDYAIQDISLPLEIIPLSCKRIKPWGTGHAVLSAESKIKTPFAVINADDYYGSEAFLKIAQFLNQKNNTNEHAFIAYPLKNTLSEFGTVSRGCCKKDEENYLIEINEITNLQRLNNGKIISLSEPETEISEDTLVSMNLWGFQTSIFETIKISLKKFIKETDDLVNNEFYITYPVQQLIKQKQGKLKVIRSNGNWFGMTYQNDKESVKSSIQNLISNNTYPESLWS